MEGVERDVSSDDAADEPVDPGGVETALLSDVRAEPGEVLPVELVSANGPSSVGVAPAPAVTAGGLAGTVALELPGPVVAGPGPESSVVGAALED
jgi:hypothetical protein